MSKPTYSIQPGNTQYWNEYPEKWVKQVEEEGYLVTANPYYVSSGALTYTSKSIEVSGTINVTFLDTLLDVLGKPNIQFTKTEKV